MTTISPLSSIDPKASIAPDVEIGPFCRIGPNVVIGAGCKLLSHVVVTGHTTLGKNNILHPNSVLGGAPQDKKYHDEPTRLEIGDNNHFREGVTVHIGTPTGKLVTRIGSNNLFMANCHIGHDAQFGSDCTLANNAMIAGHVVCGDHVNMMGGVGIHHFVTVGEYAFLGGASRIHHDVPPYMKVDGDDEIRGLNSVGLRRAGFSAEDVDQLKRACRKLFYHARPLASAMAEFDQPANPAGEIPCHSPYVKNLVEFLRRRGQAKRGRYLETFRSA